jgi:sporulation and spore germination protein
MERTPRHRLLALTLTLASALACVAGAHAQAKPTDVKIFLVAVGDNGQHGTHIGCDDSLVAVSRPVDAGAAPLEAAIRALLAAPDETAGTLALENFWKGTDLALASVAIAKGTATIRITGHLSVAGVCDEPRISGQIDATARQFSNVKRVRVFVNGRPLAEVIR